MAYFTKQDIEKITREISKTAVRDSSFREIEEPSSKSGVPIIESVNGNYENRRIPMSKLVSYMNEKTDISKIPVAINYYPDYKTLSGFLNYVANVLRQGQQIIVGSIGADIVTYTDSHLPEQYNNVSLVLEHILNILYGDVDFPTSASDNEIIAIFNTNNDNQ